MNQINDLKFIRKTIKEASSSFWVIDLLTLRCAYCRRKLWKYDKVGKGEVLRCHKTRIDKIFQFQQKEQKIQCLCGKDIGIDKGNYIKMIDKAFTYTGTKRS